MKLNDLSPQALKAALKGGTAGWGTVASSTDHVRYMEVWPKHDWRRRRRCPCKCGQKTTHKGFANGICLTSGCEMSIARWVKTGMFPSMKRAAQSAKEAE